MTAPFYRQDALAIPSLARRGPNGAQLNMTLLRQQENREDTTLARIKVTLQGQQEILTSGHGAKHAAR